MLGFWDPTTPIPNAAPSTLNPPALSELPPHPPQETSGYAPPPRGARGLTWFSTSMAMSMNMSWSSLMLLSSLTMSLCRPSISLRACLEI